VSRKINPEIERNSASITSEQVALMALGTGSIVANIYYIQPLLSLIASTFGLSAASAGIIAMLSQLGTALGILCFVPLGDTKERRSLIVRLLFAACVSLLAMATARSRRSSNPVLSEHRSSAPSVHSGRPSSSSYASRPITTVAASPGSLDWGAPWVLPQRLL